MVVFVSIRKINSKLKSNKKVVDVVGSEREQLDAWVRSVMR